MLAQNKPVDMYQLVDYDDPYAPAIEGDEGGASHQEWILAEALRIVREHNGRVVHVRANRVGQVALFTTLEGQHNA